MRKLAKCFFAALLAVTGAVFAGGPTYQFVVIPAAPAAGQSLQLRVSVGPLACNPLPPVLTAQTLSGNLIRFNLAGSDACLPNLPAQQQTYDVGSFPAGRYVFRLADCGGNPPPGGDPCVTRSEQTIVISGSAGAMQGVSGLSSAGVAILALCLLAIGAISSRER